MASEGEEWGMGRVGGGGVDELTGGRGVLGVLSCGRGSCKCPGVAVKLVRGEGVKLSLGVVEWG